MGNRRAGLPRLTGLRWYAALLVFLYHVEITVPWRFLRPFNFGTVGVTFFFVLSGFVLAWSTRPDLPAPTFYRRRLARIYPSYILVFALTVLTIAIWPGMELTRGWLGIVATIFMIQAWIPTANYPVFAYDAPEWSLSCEAFFYVVFPFVLRILRMLTPRRRDVVVVVSLLLAVLASSLLVRSHFSIEYTNPLIRLPEFVFGMWLAIKVEEGWRPRIPMWVAVVITGISYDVARKLGASVYAGQGDYVILLPIGLLLVAAAVADLDGKRGMLANSVSIYFGEVSFAFYLVQVPMILLVSHLVSPQHAWTTLHSIAILVASFVTSMGAAVLLHHLVELPLQRRLRGQGAPSIATEDPELLAAENDSRSHGDVQPGRDSRL